MVQAFEPVEPVVPIGIDALFDTLEATFDPAFGEAFIRQCAELLRRLSADRRLLLDFIEGCGGVYRAAERFSIPQSFILAQRQPFILRVNIWQPLSKEEYRERERNLYSYDLAHNHDFRFLTVGHLGPGYVTDICEVDPATISGVPGEPVELRSLRRVALGEGHVLYFEPFTDVHDQHPPDSLSVSINLVLSLENDRGEQYEFDLESASILGPVTQGAVERTRACIRFADYFADDETRRILRELAGNASMARVREEARRAVARRPSAVAA
jgi:hypothetical protein